MCRRHDCAESGDACIAGAKKKGVEDGVKKVEPIIVKLDKVGPEKVGPEKGAWKVGALYSGTWCVQIFAWANMGSVKGGKQ